MDNLFNVFSSNSTFAIILCSIVILYVLFELFYPESSSFELNPFDVTKLINKENAVVIDIRSSEDFKKGHIVGAINFQDLNASDKKISKYKSKPIILIGAKKQIQQTQSEMVKLGFEKVYTLAGGLAKWQDDGMPITTKV